ncbi:MAG TPA: transporter [Caulobacteraceae bacterium]|jgi:glutathione synthase/RimK-type ligase-like ATP-grasp enzyme|nr:transporter [Caulobacteraceae bacterium]
MRIALLTPAPDEPRFAAIVVQWFDRVAAALRLADIEAEARTWIAPGDLSGFDGISPLLAWSYFQAPDGWAALLDRLAGLGRPIANPVDTLRWNTRKTYLAELAAAGAPVTPTLFVDQLTPELIAEAHARFGPELVAKPQMSAGAHETVRLTLGGDAAGAPSGAAMLQPFLPAVAEEGELSLFYFDRRFSHAVAKRATGGDFRVQFQFGGQYEAITPPPGAVAAADAVLAVAPIPLVYARVDLLRGPGGGFWLVELEAIEPDLYLEHAPDGGAAFAAAVWRALEE